jgi:hypothetical protein
VLDGGHHEVAHVLARDAAGGAFGGDFGEVQVHRLVVAGGQDERGSLAIAGADSPEDVGGSGALSVRRRGPRSPSCPAPGDLVLLPDPGLQTSIRCSPMATIEVAVGLL